MTLTPAQHPTDAPFWTGSPDAAASWARQRFDVDIVAGSFDDLRDSERWDVVAAFQTIEHLVDVRDALRRVRAALRPNGVAFLTTPDHGSLSRKLMRGLWPSYRPEHLLYGVLRTARNPLGSGLGRRGRREVARLGLRVGAPHPVRLLLAEQGIDQNQLGEDRLHSRGTT